MKKLLLSTLSTIALSTASFAQVSITEADMSPISTVTQTAVDTIANFPSTTLMVGATGSGQTWDFSTLLTTNIDTVVYSMPGWGGGNSAAAANAFPNANYAIYNIANGDTTFIFANKTSAKVEVVGVAIKNPTGSNQNVFFGSANPPELLFNFPMNLNSSFHDESTTVITVSADDVGQGGQGFDSVRITQNVIKDVVADASGTMTTPAYTAKPVLRFLIDKTTTTDIEVLFFGSWTNVQSQTATTKNYQWLADNLGTAIADAEMDTTQGVPGDIKKVTWLYAAPTASVQELNASNVSTYPNPAATFVNFKFENNNTNKVVVYDVTGKLVNSVSVVGNNATVNTENFANGLYIYKTFDNNGNAVNIGKFTIAK